MRYTVRTFRPRLAFRYRWHLKRLQIASRHPFAVPVVAFASLLLLTLASLIVFALSGQTLAPEGNNIVIISHDHETQIVPSGEPTVGALLAKLHLTLNPGDVVEPAPDTPIHQDDFRINIYRAAPVRIVDSGSAILTYSAATTPRSIAAQAGLTVYPEDNLTIAPADNFLQQGTLGDVVTIDRSVPVNLDINGFTSTTRTLAKNVGAFLAEKQISLGKTGHVDPGFPTPIVANQTINVVRDGKGVQSLTEVIPMPVQTIEDDSLAYGTSAIRQVGSPGEQVLTYQVLVQNGQVVQKTLIQSVTTVEPVTEVVVQGTNLSGIKGDMALAGIAPSDYQYADYIISHESGWCTTKWQGQYGTCPVYHGTPSSPYVGYGLCQATPGYKMASAGADWATNPITQLNWCSGYATSRYGGWFNAYLHWTNYHSW